MIRVLIADDHAIVRKGMRQIVADHPEIEIIGEADDYPAISRAVRSLDFEVMLLDITMPSKNGLEVLKLVKQQKPQIAILMLSMHPQDQYAVRALKAGAAGYLTKDAAPERLVEAILTVARGRKYITPELAEQLANAVTHDAEKPLHEQLSDREFQTIRLIASGKKLAEIAEEMALSPKTVSVYRARVLEKMQMKTNAELASYAVKHGLIE
ncbi:response regulator transcription factor [Parvibium lacunae]|uniref:DNA-binding response regulator n=1 Tax=Parvibium lacunae TaxID=1888893 RepID=A0A368KYB3_9BURK|nr:response regulator transcription factor [Parvibium lacunae]RCS56450.1 DNA-binding response regulator [Parvibium lacunae]